MMSREERKRRLTGLAAAIGLAVIVVAVAILVSSGGGNEDSSTSTGSGAVVAQVTATLAGTEQAGDRLGQKTARVSMDYYGDLQCPICKHFTEAGLNQAIRTDVVAGTLKVRYRALQTATPDVAAFEQQQVAALAAGRQDKAWNFVELFYRQQGQEGTGYVTESFLERIADQVPGLNIATWKTDRKDPALLAAVRADKAAAGVAGVTGTPTLIIRGPKGSKTLVGNVPSADIQAAVTAVSG